MAPAMNMNMDMDTNINQGPRTNSPSSSHQALLEIIQEIKKEPIEFLSSGQSRTQYSVR